MHTHIPCHTHHHTPAHTHTCTHTLAHIHTCQCNCILFRFFHFRVLCHNILISVLLFQSCVPQRLREIQWLWVPAGAQPGKMWLQQELWMVPCLGLPVTTLVKEHVFFLVSVKIKTEISRIFWLQCTGKVILIYSEILVTHTLKVKQKWWGGRGWDLACCIQRLWQGWKLFLKIMES